MNVKRLIGVALIVSSSIAYGTLPIFARLAYADGASPFTVLFLRFTLASAFLLIYMISSHTVFPRGKVLIQLVLMGVIGYVGQSLAYFLAISLAPAGLVALLLYLSPVLVTFGSFVFLHERLTLTKLLALLVALAGAVLTISAGGKLANTHSDTIIPGIILGILAAVVGAAYVLLGSRVLRAAPAIPATTVIITSTAVTYAALTAAQGFTFPVHWNGYAAILGLATISTVFAISTFMAGLQRVGPANASTLGVLEPASAVVLAALILGETILPGQIIGGLMICFAVVIISRNV